MVKYSALTVQEQTVAWILVDKTGVATSIARALYHRGLRLSTYCIKL
jgi:hypothetical protein